MKTTTAAAKKATKTTRKARRPVVKQVEAWEKLARLYYGAK